MSNSVTMNVSFPLLYSFYVQSREMLAFVLAFGPQPELPFVHRLALYIFKRSLPRVLRNKRIVGSCVYRPTVVIVHLRNY